VDTRGYLRIVRQNVLAARAQYFTSSATLPPYERLLLGGSPTLRGFRAGAFDGDQMLLTSLEVRTPLTSVISGARLGLTVFGDAAKVTNHGQKIADAPWRRSAGAGIFMIASVIRVNLDVAHGFDGGGTRVHLASGFSF
jgi:hemolysin activation/secretion protein